LRTDEEALALHTARKAAARSAAKTTAKAKPKSDPPVWFSLPRLVSPRAIFVSAMLAASLAMIAVKSWHIAVVVGFLHLAHVARLESRKIELGALALFVVAAAWWTDIKPVNSLYMQIGRQIEAGLQAVADVEPRS
jgi:hypothetical protein